MTLKFDLWPWKTIGHLFNATSSFAHHFVAIGEFKLELQSGKAQFGLKSTIFFSRVTLQIDVWPWKTIGHLSYAASSFVHHFITIGEFKLELQSGNAQFWSKSTILEPCDLDIWPMTLKNNRASLIYYFKLCASFRSYWWIQTGVTAGNTQSGSNSTIIWAVWPWNWTDDLEKQYGTSSKQHQAVCIISSSYVYSNWSYSPEAVKFGFDLCDLDLWRLTSTFCMDITFAIGNNSCKFHDDTMMGT